jgi:phosphoserine phosphatase
MTRYASVVVDVDSTLSCIEGIEWLSARRGADVQQRIRETTDAAMRGDVPLESVYGERLQLVQPTRAEVDALGQAYIDAVAPGAADAIAALREAGVRVVVVSGGVREGIVPLAQSVGVPDTDVHAVSLRFGADGTYAGYDVDSPLARRGGKPQVVGALGLDGPILAVGDGITDAELKSVVQSFAAFVGTVRHDTVVQRADYVVSTFTALPGLVLV